MNNIYIVRGTEQAGPFTEADIRAQLASGALTGDSMVWWEGLPEWTPISKTPLGAGPAITPPFVGAPPVPPARPVAPMPGQFTPAPAVTSTATTSTLAVASLVCGLLGLLCGFASIGAVVTGHLARGEIKRNPHLSGKGLALTGLILGYFVIALIVVVLAIYLVAFSYGISQGWKEAQSDSSSPTTNAAPANP